MARQQLFALCVYNLLICAIRTTLVALFPLYATRFGADSGAIGFSMALAYLALSAGMIAAGWLSDRVQRRRELLVATGLANVLIVACMSQVTSVGALVLVTSVAWFCFGVSMATVTILAGLFVGSHERGSIFGILGCSVAAGNVLAGLCSGPVVDRWGFDVFFAICAVVSLFAPITALFVEDTVVQRKKDQAARPSRRGVYMNRSYLLLFAGSLLISVAVGETLLGRPLLMDGLGYYASAITGSFAAGALVGLPLPIIVGRLSDRLPRMYVLLGCYGIVALGLVVLAGSTSLWHFWLSAGLLTASVGSMSVGSALVADVTSPSVLGAALSWFHATNWIGFVLGLLIVGVGAQSAGLQATILVGAGLAVTAGLVLLLFRSSTAGRRVVALDAAPSMR